MLLVHCHMDTSPVMQCKSCEEGEGKDEKEDGVLEDNVGSEKENKE